MKQFVPDAPDAIADYSDGIAVCKLISEVAHDKGVQCSKYNARPKMALQKVRACARVRGGLTLAQLNNVHLAVTTMEALGIVTAGINTKDVVDGNEKQIMSIIRLLHSYSKKVGGALGGKMCLITKQQVGTAPRKTGSGAMQLASPGTQLPTTGEGGPHAVRSACVSFAAVTAHTLHLAATGPACCQVRPHVCRCKCGCSLTKGLFTAATRATAARATA